MNVTPVEVPRVDSPAPLKHVPSGAASSRLVCATCQRSRSMTSPVAMSTACLQARRRGCSQTERGRLAETFSDCLGKLAFRDPILCDGVFPKDRRQVGDGVEKITDVDRGCPHSAPPNCGAPRTAKEVRVGV